jgi:hypothetical protein
MVHPKETQLKSYVTPGIPRSDVPNRATPAGKRIYFKAVSHAGRPKTGIRETANARGKNFKCVWDTPGNVGTVSFADNIVYAFEWLSFEICQEINLSAHPLRKFNELKRARR